MLWVATISINPNKTKAKGAATISVNPSNTSLGPMPVYRMMVVVVVVRRKPLTQERVKG